MSVGKVRIGKESLRKVSEDKVGVHKVRVGRETLCRLKEGKVRLRGVSRLCTYSERRQNEIMSE